MSARAWIAFAAVSTLWGIPYLFIKVAVDDGVPPFFLAWVRVVLGALVLLALARWAGVLSGTAISSLVALGVLCTAAAFALYGALVAEAGPGRALVITYIAPVVAVALGVAVLGERPGAGAAAGLLLILAGSWLATGGRMPPNLLAAWTSPRPIRKPKIPPWRSFDYVDSSRSSRARRS